MQRTTADQFRANMKEWMETANLEPVKITRKNGDAFILLEADRYHKMEMDIAEFRGLVGSLKDVAEGKASRVTDESLNATFARAKAKALTAKKSKKKVG